MFKRLINFFSGLFSLSIKDMEARRPEVAYENAINAVTAQYHKTRDAVAGIVAERERTSGRVENYKSQLAQVNADLDASLGTDNDELSAILVQRQEQLQGQLDTATAELAAISEQADKAKSDMMEVQERINKLKRERDSNVARYQSARARRQLQDQLSGMSTQPEIQALDNVRSAIDKEVAGVKLNEEMAGTDIENQLAKMRKETGASTAKSKVAALKAARAQAAGGSAKSM